MGHFYWTEFSLCRSRSELGMASSQRFPNWAGSLPCVIGLPNDLVMASS